MTTEISSPLMALQPGAELPHVAVPVTATLIVTGAIASRDFQAVHHDRDAAQARNLDDIIMNIFTTAGLIAKYVSDHAGPEGHMRKLSLRLGIPNYPGDLMTLVGRVLSRGGTSGEQVEIEVVGTNRRGTHVKGMVTITFGKRS